MWVLHPDLWRAGAWVFLFGVLVASRHLRLRWALVIAAVKVAVPLAYFAAHGMGALHLKDDLAYYYNVLPLLQAGHTPGSLLAHPVLGLTTLQAVSGGQAIAYFLWNFLAVWGLGSHYAAPVFLNVALTFVAGWFLFRILRLADFPVPYAQGALAFFLLHWDVVAWSSFLNLKEILAMTWILAMLYHAMAIVRSPTLWRGIVLTLLLGGMVFLRFYVSSILLFSLAAYLLLYEKGARRILFPLFALGATSLFVAWRQVRFVKAWAWSDPGDIFLGLPHFLLTPLPWNLSDGYEFLFVPSLLHLVMLGPALAVLPSLWRRSGLARLPLIFMILVAVAFAIVPELRGPRHRVQLSFLLAWMQFHALWTFFRYASRPVTAPSSSGRASSPA